VTAYVLALALATTTLLPAADDTFSGEWKVRNDIAGNVSEMTCTIALKGQDLTGTCVSDVAKIEIAGTVEGANVVWIGRTTHEGNPLTLRYTGANDGAGTIAGTVAVEEFSVTGEFKATAVKK
jgi:hypothetical protein